ncbi:MAG: aminotransferase class III-fold pyridoxal phosphate-dependent enzyme [Thermodesulfobacteriota bacterium]
MNQKKSHVLSVFLNQSYPAIVKGEGVYLWDDQGKRYLDATGGPILCNLGHGVPEMAEALLAQMKQVAFVYRMDFTTPALETAAAKVCEVSGGVIDRVFFVSGGSEATEISVKLARKYQIDRGQPAKHMVISRWQSYHGMTNGALSWSGFTFRRNDYLPYLRDFVHIPPAYCYRCWFNRTPEDCALECAQALENEIMCLGPEHVAAFIAEPVSGMALCGAAPPRGYFPRIREICDRFGVLLILDEVMTGFGRTGKWFGYEHYDAPPDIIALGKGLGGGYFPIGAAACSAKVADAIAGKSGLFAAGFTWAGNPMGAAVVCRTIDYLKERALVERAARMGDYLGRKMEELRSHPTVGDVRGLGLMRGLEFVQDKKNKKPLDPGLLYWLQLGHECRERGLNIEVSSGCDRGQAGDMVMLGPPFIVTEEQVDEIITIFDQALTAVEKRNGF